MSTIQVRSALIATYHKEGLKPILEQLHTLNVNLYALGGTHKFITQLNMPCTNIADWLSDNAFMSGRLKTFDSKIYAAILANMDKKDDIETLNNLQIPKFDLLIVDFYPFLDVLDTTKISEEEQLEFIDIGGISMVRAAAKNYQFTTVVASPNQYAELTAMLQKNKGKIRLKQRRYFAAQAFNHTSHHDTQVFNYLNQKEQIPALKISEINPIPLKYGENPHQKAAFFGQLNAAIDILSTSKTLTYNQLADIDTAIALINDFDDQIATFALVKQGSPCGVASRKHLIAAFEAALASDPVSAFGAVLVSNQTIDLQTAQKIDKLFYSVLIAPKFDAGVVELLNKKANRILIVQKNKNRQTHQFKSLLNGFVVQEQDNTADQWNDFRCVTLKQPDADSHQDTLFASKVVKHTKTNAIVIVKNEQLIGSGAGQASRIDALRQAIHKARSFNFDVRDAVLASDAYFPFADCVEECHQQGIGLVLQTGGSIRDQESIDYCNEHQMSMIFSNIRHFKY